MNKIGFMGAGNMGGAIISGMIDSKNFDASKILVCDKVENENLKAYNLTYVNEKTMVSECNIIVLAVKPANIFEVSATLKASGDISKTVFISIAAGISTDKLSAALETEKIIRVMPNLCLKAKEGMCVMSACKGISDDELSFAEKIFSCSGKTAIVKESLIDSCTAINGSGPAYVFMFIEAMADAAVKHGIDRKTAYMLSCQTLIGSAAMVMETQMHPGQLKDMVCSPGGTTIEAVQVLEESGLRASVMAAIDACVMKAKEMGK